MPALRIFSGVTIEKAAAAPGISTRTVKRVWTAARGGLFRKMSGHVA